MKKTFLAGVLALGLLIAGSSAYGFSFTYYPEFGPSVFDENNNTSPVNYPYGIGYVPSPGQAGIYDEGESYDEEGLFVSLQSGAIYGALTNSFGSTAYSTDWGKTYQTGHLFFGFDGSYDEFALDLDDGKLYKVNSWNYIPSLQCTYYNYDGGSIRDQIGAFRMADGDYIATLSDFMLTPLTNYEGIEDGPEPLYSSGNRDTYVYEWHIDMSLLSSYLSGPVTSVKFHHTLGCGNDLIEREAVIPEPTTLILFGSGLIGIGLYRRRRKK